MRRSFMRAFGCALFIHMVSLLGTGLQAQERSDSAEIERMRRQIDAITRELEALRVGREAPPLADTSMLGLAPAASKVYRVNHGVSIGGYGEILYEKFAGEREDESESTARDRVDALRAILYVGYKFNDRLLFNSELEFEHGSTDKGGSASIEFAYVDYLFSPSFGARAGLLLVPMGFLNELHEPPIFLGTTRTLTENALIPTTWRENGAGVFGSMNGFDVRAYVVNGLDGSGFNAGGLRGGRQKGALALVEDAALVVRADYTPQQLLPGAMLGASFYMGGSDQGKETESGAEIDAQTTIWEGHAQYRAHGLDLRALYALASIDDAAILNAANDRSPTSGVAEELGGWYLQAGYDVLRFSESTHQVIPYVRYEQLNTQRAVPTGYTVNASSDRTALLLGAAWKPITQVVVKADYQIHSNAAETGNNQFNVALGYLF